ncbi:MAG: hypothetical protein ACT6FD_06920 [Methanosarcinaceae archaeon]
MTFTPFAVIESGFVAGSVTVGVVIPPPVWRWVKFSCPLPESPPASAVAAFTV